ncbi:uncharacterized protein [Salmo salar]|uniref:Uncharacterized protein n=1 Tax=Salmo salar TaxID=8030 RepID=A0A1S3S564_SALSA|nr:uncharacterized protein LOC106607242 [Salmo salar]|eukprot:XP_014059486.1 PREDICTED: uncharacterized protein LOC106607242 [Salmo salar]
MDVQLSISFLRDRLGGAIEEAVRTAVESVLSETVRLLTGLQGDQQQGLSSVTQRDQDTLGLKQRLEAPSGGDWRVQAGSSEAFCNTGPRGGGGRGNIKNPMGQTTCSTSQASQRTTVEPHPQEVVEDCAGLPDPFDLVSAGPVMVDFEESQGMGIPEEWELMNRVYKTEHNEDMALIDRDGTTHFADDHRLHEGDLRTVAVPLEGEMAAKPQDALHPCFSPANIKTERPEMERCCMAEEALALRLPHSTNSGVEAGEFGQEQVEAGPQDFVGRLRLWLEQLCPEVVREYEREGCLCELSRRKLIKFSVSFIVEEFGFYPTSAQKTMLAEHIVELFPGLRLCAPSAGINGIEHLYDPLSRTGYIETRLRNSRRTLEDHKKKYVLKRRRPEPGLLDPAGPRSGPGLLESQSSEETQRWVELMKKTRPLTRNLPAIHSAMDLTFNARRRWISNTRPSMRAVLAEYPRFLDVPATIDLEFERMFPGKGHSFLAQWSSFVLPRVYQIAECEKHPDISALLQLAATQQGDSYTLTMLTVLIYVLTSTNTSRSSLPSRSSVRQAIRYLVDIVPMDTEVSSLFCDPTSLEGPESASHAQPYIVSVGPLEAPGRQLCIVFPVDRMAIPLPQEGLSNALDKLFKLLRVFELGYPDQLASLYGFLEHLYGLEMTPRDNHDSPSGKGSKVLELLSRLHMPS